MNAIFVSQSGSIKMFHDLALKLESQLNLSNIGMVVSHRRSVNQFIKSHKSHRLNTFNLVKEWEITNNYKKTEPNLTMLGDYCTKLNVNNFWDAIVADRRLMQNIKATYFQNYTTPYTHIELLQILQSSLVQVEKLFDTTKPDFVVSFICVTLIEYLVHLFAKSRGIPILNMRTTRIEDFMVFGNDIQEPTTRIKNRYFALAEQDHSKELEKEATEIYERLKNGIFQYEGVGIHAGFSVTATISKYISKIIKIPKVFKLLYTDISIKLGDLKDKHDPGIIVPLMFDLFYKPAVKKLIHWNLRKQYVNQSELSIHNYAFFPLHLEPEVALLVYGRYHTNQIEVIRNIATSLPVGMELLVKDHPKSMGRRKLSYYQKILEIPNCKLINPYINTDSIINNANIVITIGGSAGWESIIKETPVIVLGNAAYEFLPDTMVRKIRGFHTLSDTIHQLITEYTHDKTSILRYLMAVISESQRLNFYSTLLNRQGVATGSARNASNTDEWDTQISFLAAYTEKSLNNL